MTNRHSGRLNSLARRRELSGRERAGAFARGRARSLEMDFLRRAWRPLSASAAGILVCAVPIWLFAPGPRQFLLGAWIAGWLALLWQWTWFASGAASVSMGDLGEQWTLAELRKARGKGWRWVNQIEFKAGQDIDTVAIGPSGVVVLETKWSGQSWSDPIRGEIIERAVRQVQGNGKLIERQVRQVAGPVPIHAAVVLWPARDLTPRPDVGGVAVLPGNELERWIQSLPRSPSASPAQLDQIWAFLEQHVERRDAYLARTGGLPPRSMERRLHDGAEYVFGAAAGVLIVGLMPRTLVLWVVTASLIVGACSLAARVTLLRRFATGLGAAVAGIALAALCIAAWATV